MINSVYQPVKCGIWEQEDGTQEWIIELAFQSPVPTHIKNFSKTFTGYGKDWRQIGEAVSVPERLIAKLNAIASEKALELI